MSAAPKYPRELGYAGLRMTAEEYLAIGETQERYELIDGVVVMSPSPTSKHQRVIRILLTQFGLACERMPGLEALPEYDIRLGPGLVYCPDVVVFAPGRFSDAKGHAVIPDLVIEILSPRTKAFDLFTKRDDYERHGVGEYWVIDPETGAVRCWRRDAERLIETAISGDLITCAAIPGLAVDLRPIRRAATE